MATPNIYNVHSNVIQGGQWSVTVAYSTAAGGAIPGLRYQDQNRVHSFSLDQMRIVDTEIGTLVTVTLSQTVDNGSTSFTLFVPRANVGLGQSNQSSIRTFGVTTLHRFSPVPAFNQGQSEIYTVTELDGTAEFIAF
jgi:hypothetical protein